MDGDEDMRLDCVSDVVRSYREQGSAAPQSSSPIRYIWLHVTREGITGTRSISENGATMLLNDWLNVVDESAALGAKWMIVYFDTHVDKTSDAWKICSWAQEVHDIRVGLHINSRYLQHWDFSSLSKLDTERTFIVSDQSKLQSLSFLEERGYTLCHSNIGEEDREMPCTHTDSIVCAGADGVMFCCGLVVGEESYRLGDVRSDSVGRAMQNHAGLEPILFSRGHTETGCDGCPPIMAQRFSEQHSG